MALIDIDRLRDYLRDYAGTAMFSGFPAAFLDVVAIDSLSDEELCRKAEEWGIDLSPFVREDDSKK